MATVKKQDNVKVLKNVPVAFTRSLELVRNTNQKIWKYVIDCIVDKAT